MVTASVVYFLSNVNINKNSCCSFIFALILNVEKQIFSFSFIYALTCINGLQCLEDYNAIWIIMPYGL